MSLDGVGAYVQPVDGAGIFFMLVDIALYLEKGMILENVQAFLSDTQFGKIAEQEQRERIFEKSLKQDADKLMLKQQQKEQAEHEKLQRLLQQHRRLKGRTRRFVPG